LIGRDGLLNQNSLPPLKSPVFKERAFLLAFFGYHGGVKTTIEILIKQTLSSLGIEASAITLEHPADLSNGDYSTSVALVYAKQVGKNPKQLAEEIVSVLKETKNDFINEIKVAGPGFINFYLTKEFFHSSIKEINTEGGKFGKGESLKGQTTMIEYTDPNVMKPFHIGHLMSNSIGEAISRLVEWNGSKVIRANYYSDSGLNIAKAVWGIQAKKEEMPVDSASYSNKAKFLGQAYAFGVAQSEGNETIAEEVREINKKIFSREDGYINELFDIGKQWSLAYLSELYTRLGSSFDFLIGESEVSEDGKKIVLEFLDKGVFEKSEGAIVFHGEKFNKHLHTRVFINKENLPTYEAKELGLTKKKFETYNPDLSVVITANEQSDYFKVVLEAMKQIFPDFALKTKHLSHGILRFATGKMSSRTGNVITAEELIEQVKASVASKGDIAQEDIAIGAIKYMILRQSIGGDIIFDIEKSVSTEGDSGVYLQYAYARTNSLLEKAGEPTVSNTPDVVRPLEKLLYRFPEIVERAMLEYSPNLLLTYLTEISASFSNLYSEVQIISDTPESPYLVSVTRAFNTVLKNGLTILGIPTPERM
jgi:arginyl-tRNA synthetase